MAKLGYLYLQNGKWDQQQIIPADWVKAASTSRTTKDNGLGYGYLWTVDPKQKSFSALGLAGQQIYLIPDQDLLVVFTSLLPSYQPDMDFLPLKALVDTYILPSVKSDKALPKNDSAVARLNEQVAKAANPLQAVKPAPAGSAKWSGLEYQLDENPFQWKTIAFDFTSDPKVIPIRVNGEAVDPPVGLDHVFRIQKPLNENLRSAIRGHWENENTLFIQLITIGGLNDYDFRVVFSDDAVDLSGTTVYNGQQIKLHGKPAQPGD